MEKVLDDRQPSKDLVSLFNRVFRSVVRNYKLGNSRFYWINDTLIEDFVLSFKQFKTLETKYDYALFAIATIEAKGSKHFANTRMKFLLEKQPELRDLSKDRLESKVEIFQSHFEEIVNYAQDFAERSKEQLEITERRRIEDILKNASIEPTQSRPFAKSPTLVSNVEDNTTKIHNSIIVENIRVVLLVKDEKCYWFEELTQLLKIVLEIAKENPTKLRNTPSVLSKKLVIHFPSLNVKSTREQIRQLLTEDQRAEVKEKFTHEERLELKQKLVNILIGQ